MAAETPHWTISTSDEVGNDFLSVAAAGGHLPILPLLSKRWAVNSQVQLEHGLVIAIPNGRLPADYPYPARIASVCAIKLEKLSSMESWISCSIFTTFVRLLIKWLHTNRTEGCTRKAMSGAAAQGHLEVFQWLQVNTTAACTTQAMDLAAGRGHLKMLHWLHIHRSEGCTDKAIDDALELSRLPICRGLVTVSLN
ncbi:hypothetical protein PHMEG_00011494 [Phytophthora megakarya]|uniref:Uncharacterized protein n=1 Tax=Phytophthora megakarya TaxID=4795 RepID=A0A225WBE2_9STRA|nr:hypothetical protein PHMEG_00011494 [Phytophthora megakarya]